MPEEVYLKVFANPFCAARDHEGRACGAIKFEPPVDAEDGFDYGSVPFLGCTVIATPKAKGRPGKKPPRDPDAAKFVHKVVASGNAKDADWDHVWEYHTEPTLVPQTPYYMEMLLQHGQHGPALLPADEETYKLVHGTLDRWRSPHERLHQYACERNLIPRLRATPEILEAKAEFEAKLIEELAKEAAAAHAEKRAIRPPKSASYERDHKAEWEAFVGKEVVAKRAAWEAGEPTHPNSKKAEQASTSATA